MEASRGRTAYRSSHWNPLATYKSTCEQELMWRNDPHKTNSDLLALHPSRTLKSFLPYHPPKESAIPNHSLQGWHLFILKPTWRELCLSSLQSFPRWKEGCWRWEGLCIFLCYHALHFTVPRPCWRGMGRAEGDFSIIRSLEGEETAGPGRSDDWLPPVLTFPVVPF